jgi:hypothetical protein
MNLLKRYPLGAASFGAALLLILAQGCSDSGNDNVKPPDVNGGSSSTGGKGSGGSKTSGGTAGKSGGNSGGDDQGGAPSPSGGTGGTETTGGKGGTTTSDAGSGNEAGSDNPPIPACDKPEKGADGCFNCPKDKELDQWLNRCTDGDCVPFDNKARLPKLKADGSVPPLPV